jgi:hypothetical protein
MRQRIVRWCGPLTLAAVGALALAQNPPPRPLPANLQPANFVPATDAAQQRPARDLSKLPPLTQQIYLSGQRGGEWLFRAHQVTGEFVYGWLPAVNQPMEGNHFLRQAGAAVALARAARFLKDERYTARARQSVLWLLDQTGPAPTDPKARCTTLPSNEVNRLAAAGLLLLAIHELPDPAPNLLDQGEQLALFIYRQQRPDGSLSYVDGPDEKGDPDGVLYYPGEALYGLMRSQQLRPAPWKLALAQKAMAYYRGYWKGYRHPAFVPWQSAAYAEAYRHSKDAGCAEYVFEMNDWLCALQYNQLNGQNPLWFGGFQNFADGKPLASAPQVGCAAYAESLVEACRVARQMPDAQRYERYRSAAEQCLRFLTTLQYTEGNTQHFAPQYRQEMLLGGFHGSHQDGNLRVDYTQHAICAMVQYLRFIVDL